MNISSRLLLGVVCAAFVGIPDSAFASGFAVARFGGEHGNPTETNPSTIYYNPAGFGLSEGMNIMLDLNTAFRSATYDRPASAVSTPEPYPGDADLNDRAIAANTGEGSVNNTILSPMVGVTSDLFVDSPVKLGLAFFAPFGGQAVWDRAAEDERFPGAVDGSQRWYTIDGTIRTLSTSFAAAYGIESLGLSFGLAGNLYLTEINTLRARDADGTDDLEAGGGTIKEGRSWVDASSTDFGIGGGVLWEALEKKLWLGLSYQSRPNITGDMQAEGTLRNYLGAADQTEAPIILTTSLPDIFRLGARFRPMEELELRLFGDFTRWSAFEQQCLIDAEASDIEEACEVNADGSQANEDATVPIQNLQRGWNDAFGVRVGASYWINDLELMLGGGYDGNAVPDEALDPALMDMNKFTASLGGAYQIAELMTFGVTATNVFYLERDTAGVAGNESLELPSRQPGNQGVYNQNVFLINTNLQFQF